MGLLQHVGWQDLLIVFVGGLLSFFSPCVAPLVPGYIGYLSGTAVREKSDVASVSGTTQGGGTLAVQRQARLSRTGVVTLIFVAGFSCAFVLLGLLAGSFGYLFAAYRPVMETLAGIVMLVMGLFLLGLLPRGWSAVLMREGRVHLNAGRLSGLGLAMPFVLGVFFAAGWTPCIGPVLAAIFAYVGAQGSPWVGALLLTVYSAGFALPFLAVGFGWSAGLGALGWFKRYAHQISIASGVLLVLVSLVYLTGEVQVFSTWAQQLPLGS